MTLQTDADFIEADDNWPNWPVLPMKSVPKLSEQRRFGFIHQQEKTVIYLQPLWTIPVGTTLADLPCDKFESIEALLAAGWMVD